MRIFVTDAQELAGLGAIRSLGRAGHEVVAGFPEGLARPASTYSRYCAGHRSYPDPWHAQADFRTWLIAQGAAYDLLLPISEAALVATSRCGSDLPESVKAILPPSHSLEFILSKRRATAKAIEIGLHCPSTAFSHAEIERLRPPYIVRTDNRLMANGSYQKGRTRYVEEPAELADLLVELDGNGEQWIVQESVSGKGAGAFLLRWQDQTPLSFAHERIHEVPFYGGWSSLRRSVRSPQMIGDASKLLSAIGFEGVAMVEFRSDESGARHFIEINGRLWGSLALALHAGVDFPKKLIECHAGIRPGADPANYPVGLRCRNVYPGELNYLWSIFKAGGPVRGVRPPGKARALLDFVGLFFSPNVRYDYFWPSDPIPGILQTVHGFERVLNSLWQKLSRKLHRTRLVREFNRKHARGGPDLRQVLFLCYGNICRSPFAEAYWNSRIRNGSPARSAGFHVFGNRRTPTRFRTLAHRLGGDLGNHRSKTVDAMTIEWATAIFVMDGENIEDLLSAFPDARSKTFLLGPFSGSPEIRDPFTMPEPEAEGPLRQIASSIDQLARSKAQAAPARRPDALS
ncbi:MAG TPA: ATP-grasp domain-containing protein [Burkholderiales bacterium]|nr:ATP-grasp domain-containing protein [Burkholderiales bacterium]